MIYGVLANCLVCFGMSEVAEGVEHFVVCAALTNFLSDDVEIAQPGDSRASNDHRFGASIDQRHYIFFKNAQHHLGFVLNQSVVLERDVLERLRHYAFRINLFFFVLRWNQMAVQIVERLVRNDARGHIDDGAFAVIDAEGEGLAIAGEKHGRPAAEHEAAHVDGEFESADLLAGSEHRRRRRR